MVILHILGTVAIRVGTRRVLPNSTRAFASLMFMAMERGRAISRTDLQELLFPGQSERTAAHNLRQLIYRLRSIGAPIIAEENTVALPADAVCDDYTLLGGAALDQETLKAIACGVLPGYAPAFSRPFSEWLDGQRSRVSNDVLRRVVDQLTELRRLGRWRDLEPVARACLALDSLNEEATLSLAESLALNGQKARAMQLLDTYIEDMGPYGKALHIPAHVLRTRISEHVRRPSYRRMGPGPFVGRDAEMVELWRHYQRAKHGEPRTVVIHGEPGIGKTRLATEFLKAAALDGATCLRVECAPHDVRRPLGVFVDLVPKLLDAPGGLGVAPEAMDELRRLTHRGAPVGSQLDAIEAEGILHSILRSLADLFDAVASERPLAVLVDNSDWMDGASADALSDVVFRHSAQPLLIMLTARLGPSASRGGALRDRTCWIKTVPLPPPASTALFHALTRSVRAAPTSTIAENCVRTARGNPLFLRALIADARPAADGSVISPTLKNVLTYRVRQLDDNALRAFVASAILGKYSTPSRLAEASGLGTHTLIQGVHELEALGFIDGDIDNCASAHPLLSQVALAEIPSTTRRLMHATAAASLGASHGSLDDAATLWASAEHWVQAGETTKAVELLVSCAEHCLQIGQPIVGCDLLRRASVLDRSRRRIEVLKRLVGAARLAGDYKLVREAVASLRDASGGDTHAVTHDEFEIFDLEAARFSGGSAVEFIPEFSRCLTTQLADTRHRLMAATNLVIAFDLALEPGKSSEAYSQVSDLVGSTPQEIADRNKLDLFYHCFVGKPETALALAVADWERLGQIVPSWRDLRTAVSAGTTMFRCGDPRGGMSVLNECFSVAKRAGIQSFMIDTSSMLSWMFWIIGDADGRQHWDGIADAIFAQRGEQFGRISHFLSNKIEYALDVRDCVAARKWLALAEEQYGEITTPRIRLFVRAFKLRMAQIEGRTDLSPSELKTLNDDHSRGKTCGLHDNFVEAFWHALTAAGSAAEANAMLLEYVTIARRDRFPLIPALGAILSSSATKGNTSAAGT